jgi:tRNA1Val (adenine37-N6)-methyltransferase
MPNPFFKFKQFTVYHDRCSMKVTTDACLFGAWCAQEISKANLDRESTVLDIGTGASLLSLMVAQKNSLCIDAVELDKEAATQAQENVAASDWKDQITIYNKNILEFAPERKYDVIISNPPFYEREIESSNLDRNKAHHGHSLKLEELFLFIKGHLSSNGMFFLLLPYKRLSEIKSLFTKNSLYIETEVIVKPSVQHLPFRVLIKGRHLEPVVTITLLLALKNEEDQYSEEFVALLKDYYLYL